MRRRASNAYAGDTMHLTCVSLSPMWTFNSERVSPSEKRQITTEGGLVLFNVRFLKYPSKASLFRLFKNSTGLTSVLSKQNLMRIPSDFIQVSGADSGSYECSVSGDMVIIYEVTVDECKLCFIVRLFFF